MKIAQGVSPSRIKEHWEYKRTVFVHNQSNELFVGGIPLKDWEASALQQEARIFKVVNRVTGEKFYLHKTLGEFERALSFKAIELKLAKEHRTAFAVQRGKRISYYVVKQGWFANKVVKSTCEEFKSAIAAEDQPSLWQKASAVGMAAMTSFTGIVGGAILAQRSVEHLPSMLSTAFSMQNLIIPFQEPSSSFFKLPSSMLLANLVYQQTKSLPCFYTMLMGSVWPQAVKGQAALTLDLATLTSSQGMIIIGANTGDNSGISVSSAGDVNGDGKTDLLIGAELASPFDQTYAGTTYLLYGSSSNPGILDLSILTSSQGMVILGAAALDESGSSVSSAGDVNGDGKADLLIGADNASPSSRNAAGTTYLLYGNSSLPNILKLSNLTSMEGMVMLGAAGNENSGSSVSSAGDVTGDGKADLLIGTYQGSPPGRYAAGKSYLIYGSSNLPSTLDLLSLSPNQGMVILGAIAGDHSGNSVSSAGDVNGDGKADLLIGAPQASPFGRSHAGTSYLLYGNSSLPGTLDLLNLTSSQGMVILGASAGDFSGFSVSSAGDVNGDGKADLLIGAINASPSGRPAAGKIYLLYGSSSLPGALDLSNLTSSQGMVILGAAAHDDSGYSVSSAGDMNGDGKADLLIGAGNASPPCRGGAGTSYLLYGNSSLPGILDLSNLTSSQGTLIFGAAAADFSGNSVSSAGDVNGDGKVDILIGANAASTLGRTHAGTSYLLYGPLSQTPTQSPSGMPNCSPTGQPSLGPSATQPPTAMSSVASTSILSTTTSITSTNPSLILNTTSLSSLSTQSPIGITQTPSTVSPEIPPNGGISKGGIAAVVLGVLALLGSIGAFAAGYFLRRRKNEERDKNIPMFQPPSTSANLTPQESEQVARHNPVSSPGVLGELSDRTRSNVGRDAYLQWEEGGVLQSGPEPKVGEEPRVRRHSRQVRKNVPAAILGEPERNYEDTNWTNAQNEALTESGRSPENLRLSTRSSPRKNRETGVQPVSEKHYGKLNIAAAAVVGNGFDPQAGAQEVNPPRYDAPPKRPAPNLPTPQNIEPGYRLPPKAEEVDPQLQADVQQVNPPRYQILHPKEHGYDPAPPGRPAANPPTPQNIEPGYRLPPRAEEEIP